MIRKIGQENSISGNAIEPRAAPRSIVVLPLDPLCETLDSIPDEAQFVLFTELEGKQFLYWGETKAGPWHECPIETGNGE